MNTPLLKTDGSIDIESYRQQFLACEAQGVLGDAIQTDVMHSILRQANVLVVDCDQPYARMAIDALFLYTNSHVNQQRPIMSVPNSVMLPLFDMIEAHASTPYADNVLAIADYRSGTTYDQPADYLVSTV
jgi:hypothetical protein